MGPEPGRDLRYPVAITNGIITNGGDSPATVSRRVAHGAVRVTVQMAVHGPVGRVISARAAAAVFGAGKARSGLARAGASELWRSGAGAGVHQFIVTPPNVRANITNITRAVKLTSPA